MASYEDKILVGYFEWLYKNVCKGRVNNSISYKKLFTLLHDMTFTYSIRNDFNRSRDGIDLRYRFAMEKGDDNIVHILDAPCSVLEMLVALAIRCEETIMDDPRYGDRTGQWFWIMMTNLGVDLMTDDRFDKEFIEERIYDFLDRRYSPNGKGGLFYIRDCRDDLRNVEIWTQLCWYLEKFT